MLHYYKYMSYSHRAEFCIQWISVALMGIHVAALQATKIFPTWQVSKLFWACLLACFLHCGNYLQSKLRINIRDKDLSISSEIKCSSTRGKDQNESSDNKVNLTNLETKKLYEIGSCCCNSEVSEVWSSETKNLLSPANNCVQSKLQMLDQRIIDQCRNHDVCDHDQLSNEVLMVIMISIAGMKSWLWWVSSCGCFYGLRAGGRWSFWTGSRFDFLLYWRAFESFS